MFGNVSATAARSAKNLSNSLLVKLSSPSFGLTPDFSALSHSSISSKSCGFELVCPVRRSTSSSLPAAVLPSLPLRDCASMSNSSTFAGVDLILLSCDVAGNILNQPLIDEMLKLKNLHIAENFVFSISASTPAAWSSKSMSESFLSAVLEAGTPGNEMIPVLSYY